MAYHTTPEIDCDCDCHGPNLGFYHCFDDGCKCGKENIARNIEVEAERKAIRTMLEKERAEKKS